MLGEDGPAPVVLVAHRDPETSRQITAALTEDDHVVRCVATATDVLSHGSVDVAVIDAHLPGLVLAEVCVRLHAASDSAAVIVLDTEVGLAQRLAAFDAGVDDWVAEPVALSELRARVRAQARRRGPGRRSRPDLTLDPLRRQLSEGHASVSLSALETTLFAELLRTPGALVQRHVLLEAAWPGQVRTDNHLDKQLARMRRRLRQLGSERALVTVRGHGYALGPAPHLPLT